MPLSGRRLDEGDTGGTTQAPTAYGPSTQNYGPTNVSPTNQIAQQLSVAASGQDPIGVQNQINALGGGPSVGNYTIGGLSDYQSAMRGLGNSAMANAGYYKGQTDQLAAGARANDNAFQSGNAYGARQQLDAYNRMSQLANGQGPSLARANMQAGLAQQNAAIQAQGMSLGGAGGYGNSQRNILNAQANAGNNVVNQGNVASVAEQLGALNSLGSQSNAMAAAGLQSTGLANNTQLGAYNAGANAMNQGYNTLYNAQNGILSSNVAQQGANAAYEQQKQNYGQAEAGLLQHYSDQLQENRPWFAKAFSDEKLKTNVSDTHENDLKSFLDSINNVGKVAGGLSSVANGAGLTGLSNVVGGAGGLGVLGDLGGLAALFSDANVKTDVDNTPAPQLDEFMGVLKPKSFDYVDGIAGSEAAPAGRNHGIMAQDMERSAIGKDIVENTPSGKMLSIPKALSATLASLAHLHQRLARVEGSAHA